MNSEQPLWLIVTGPPSSGKTALARQLAQDLNMPLSEKDVLKDTLYRALGFGDKDWSRQVGVSAISLLFLIADRMLGTGASLITECNFYRQSSSERAGKIAHDAKPRVVQVHCSAPPMVLAERNAARLEQTQLRPGHHVVPERELLGGVGSGAWEPLDVPSKIVRLDMSVPFDHKLLVRDIRLNAHHSRHDG